MVNARDDLVQALGILGGVVKGVCARHRPALPLPASPRSSFTSTGAGLQAVPIIALISLLIGGIVAQQGVFQLSFFGAEDFVVDLVGILVLRELGVLLTAIMLAGRSGSAYTAEIGSMKMREELDALQVIGLDPIETLIMPRILALVIALPLLTFISDIFGLTGGALVAFIYGDMTFQRFILLLRDAVDMSTLMVGLIKAPFMGLIVGLIAANEGLNVEGSSESLGPPDYVLGGQGDLHGHRRGWPLRHLLRRDRLLTMMLTPLADIGKGRHPAPRRGGDLGARAHLGLRRGQRHRKSRPRCL